MFVLMRRDIRLLLDDGVGSIRSRGRLPVAVDKVIGRRRTTFRDFSRTGPWSRANGCLGLFPARAGGPAPGRPGARRQKKKKGRGGGGAARGGPAAFPS